MNSTSPGAPPLGAPTILLAGGDADPNLHSLRQRMLTRGFDHFSLLSGTQSNPRLTWDVQADVLTVDGREIRPAACFIRYDVFTHMADRDPESAKRAAAWFTTLAGWLHVHPEVRILNRRFSGNNNKPYQLHLARQVGLEIPVTLISNDLDALEAWSGERPLIAKPVQGGSHCREMGEMLTLAGDKGRAGPFIAQNRLVQPEVRLYRIGSRFVAFEMRSDVLDYRTSVAAQVVPMPLEKVPEHLFDGLRRLMDLLQMDFGAADFKTDPDTGRLLFLELNSSPMFLGFDLVTGGAVSDAILAFLVGEQAAAGTGFRMGVPGGGCRDCGPAPAAA